jgi:tripartite-type tricarboxylate transporter receptor subunit TctC
MRSRAFKYCISAFMGAALCLASSISGALDYPNKPVKILVGYVAGGSPDFGVDLDLKSSTKRIVSQTVVSTLNFT